jgi:hypothetical protein
LRKRRNASSTSAGVQGAGVPGFFLAAFFTGLTGLLAGMGVVLRAMEPV